MSDTYVLFALTITDDTLHKKYLEGAIASFDGTGVELVFSTDALELLEGTALASRLVLLKFPSEEAARDWYGSPSYAHAKPLRFSSADTAFATLVRTAASDDC